MFLTITNAVEPPICPMELPETLIGTTTTPGLNGFDANFTYTDDTNQDLVLEISGGTDKDLFSQRRDRVPQLFDAA